MFARSFHALSGAFPHWGVKKNTTTFFVLVSPFFCFGGGGCLVITFVPGIAERYNGTTAVCDE